MRSAFSVLAGPAMALLACASADAQAVPPAAGLPLGDGATFRKRMLDWNAPLPAAPLPVVEDEGMDLPSGVTRITSRFGARSDPFSGRMAFHKGIDIPGAYGSAVRATADGAVRQAGPAGGYGNLLIVAHSASVEMRYGHLSRILVAPGAFVRKGQVIGLVGSTGRSTGPHLHYEIRIGGVSVDPMNRLVSADLSIMRPPTFAGEPYVSDYARSVGDAGAPATAGR